MKKVTKTLTGGLATVMASGMVPMTAMAATNFDELHKAAYDAVKVAQETKTQADINAARKVVADYRAAIEAEGKDGLLVNINTFSELLDGVQQPILTDIVNKIIAMKEAGKATQEEINAVRVLVDNLPTSLQNAVNTWSSEVDTFQAALIEAATAAVKTAETEKTQEAIDAAKVLVDELATSVREGIQKVAADLQTRLDAIELYDLNVVSYEVTNSGVSVVFDALTETKTNVTIEVVNSKGEVVPVKAVSKILEGRTKATFNFVTPVFTSTLQGVWTVNGVEMDLTEAKLVKVVESKKNDSVELEKALVELQTKGYISGLKLVDDKEIDKDALAAYKAELAKKTVKTAEEVQAIIDSVNETLDVTAEETAKVNAIVNAKNDSARLKALEDAGIERVNEDYIKAYEGEFTGKTTLKGIQEAVDNYNETTIKKLVNETLSTGLDLDAVDKAIILVEDFINPETEISKGVTLQSDLLKKLEVRTVLINAATADNTTALKTNLQKLSDLKVGFEYDKVVIESNMLAYRDAFEVTANESKDEVTELVTVLQNTNNTVITEKVEAVKAAFVEVDSSTGKYTSEQKATIMKAFNELELATAKLGNSKFEAKIVVEANLESYQSSISSATDVASIKSAIETVNASPVKNALAKVVAATTETDLLEALKNESLGITNVLEGNKAAYKAEDFATAATIEGDKVDAAVTRVKTLVSTVNSRVTASTSKNVAEVKSELVKFALNSDATNVFNNKKDAVKSDIAELLIASDRTKITTNAELMSKVESLINEHSSALANLNGASVTIIGVRDQLNSISAEFKALSAEEKLVVAEEFIAARPTKDNKLVDFENFTQVREVLATVMK